MSFHQFLNRVWYSNHPLSFILIPFAWLYRILIYVRRLLYLSGILPVREVDVPIIVVGNITVGGTGKTPLVIWLAKFLCGLGYHPGIISRGYGGVRGKWPQQVRPDSDPIAVGDEALLISQRTNLPVVISPNRYLAAQQLLEYNECDILLCDDGLQHYGLKRDIEIAVIDGDRRFGNERCLPAGPLREPPGRLTQFDLLVGNTKAGKNEYLMEYEYSKLHSLDGQQEQPIGIFSGQEVHAVAGLGNPERFFLFLRAEGIKVIKHEFPDHYQYKKNDIMFNDGLAVVMTEKDAVKCRRFTLSDAWYLPVNAILSGSFEHRLTTLLKEMSDG